MVTVIITTYNDNDELDKTLDSLRKSTTVDLEVIVFDDASDVPARDIAKKYGTIYMRAPYNVGCSTARMRAAQKATYDHIVFCDSHMRFPLQWLEYGLRSMRMTDIVCFPCGTFDSHNVGYGASLSTEHPFFLRYSWNKEQLQDRMPVSCLLGGCYLMMRKWFWMLDGFNGLTIPGLDEQLLSLKCRLGGGTCVCIDCAEPIKHKFNPPDPNSDIVKLLAETLRVAHIVGYTDEQMRERMLKGPMADKAFVKFEKSRSRLTPFKGANSLERVEEYIERTNTTEPERGRLLCVT